MILWSLSPSYLDDRGLVILWREGLTALRTIGTSNHPQLKRFQEQGNPVNSLKSYLSFVAAELHFRRYNPVLKQLDGVDLMACESIPVAYEQLKSEARLLRDMIQLRKYPQRTRANELLVNINLNALRPHPLMKIVEGEDNILIDFVKEPFYN